MDQQGRSFHWKYHFYRSIESVDQVDLWFISDLILRRPVNLWKKMKWIGLNSKSFFVILLVTRLASKCLYFLMFLQKKNAKRRLFPWFWFYFEIKFEMNLYPMREHDLVCQIPEWPGFHVGERTRLRFLLIWLLMSRWSS